jgi:hypothetical protein
VVSFAVKAGPSIRSDLASSSSDGSPKWLRNVKDGKDLRVRFLQDPDDWMKFKEHYSPNTKYFPCTQDSSCPGCTSDEERLQYPSQRYIAQVFIVHEPGDAKDIGKVVPLKMSRDLANRMITRCDRNGGTLLNRDYTIIRKGNDKDTTWDAEAEDKTPFDVSKVEFVDPNPILERIYNDVWGSSSPAPREEAPVPVKTPGIRELIKNSTVGKDAEDDKPPFDPAPAQGAVVESGPVQLTVVEPKVEEPVEITEAYLRSLDMDQLATLLDSQGIKVPESVELNSTAIVDWVIAEFGA